MCISRQTPSQWFAFDNTSHAIPVQIYYLQPSHLPRWLLAECLQRWLDYIFLYVAYMRVMIVSCSYLLYEYLLKLKKIVLGLVLGLMILSSASASASWFCPRPRPQEFGLDQHHWFLPHSIWHGHRRIMTDNQMINFLAYLLKWLASSYMLFTGFSILFFWIMPPAVQFQLNRLSGMKKMKYERVTLASIHIATYSTGTERSQLRVTSAATRRQRRPTAAQQRLRQQTTSSLANSPPGSLCSIQ